MKLYYSKTSPFARKVILLAHSLKLDHEFEMEAINAMDPPASFLDANPLGKIPVLVQDGETPLFDSAVIAEFLLDRAGQNEIGRSKTEILKRQALADGMADAAFATVTENKRPDAETSKLWLDRWANAIERGFAFYEAGGVAALKDWGLDSIAAACTFDYINFRLPDINWQSRYPETSAWFQTVIARPDMQATDPRNA